MVGTERPTHRPTPAGRGNTRAARTRAAVITSEPSGLRSETSRLPCSRQPSWFQPLVAMRAPVQSWRLKKALLEKELSPATLRRCFRSDLPRDRRSRAPHTSGAQRLTARVRPDQLSRCVRLAGPDHGRSGRTESGAAKARGRSTNGVHRAKAPPAELRLCHSELGSGRPELGSERLAARLPDRRRVLRPGLSSSYCLVVVAGDGIACC